MEESDLGGGTQDRHPGLWHEGGDDHGTAAAVWEGSAQVPHIQQEQLRPPRTAAQVLCPLQRTPRPRPGCASPGKAAEVRERRPGLRAGLGGSAPSRARTCRWGCSER